MSTGAAAGASAGAAASSGFKAQAKKIFNFFAPPIAGVTVGWTLWGAGEYVAPDQMHTSALSIHELTYRGQEWLVDRLLPEFVADSLAGAGLVVPPPLSVMEKDRDEENDAQSTTMFREVFEQCRMQEGMDWLEENVTEEIPFIYINELFATWGSAFFWKHFLKKQHKKKDPKSESGLETSPSLDLKALENRVERDIGECEVRVSFKAPSPPPVTSSSSATEEEKQNEQVQEQDLITKIKIKTGGEASFIEGIWYRFAVLRQLDSAAGWSTLAVLTQNKQNALALAKIALVADSLSTDDDDVEKKNNVLLAAAAAAVDGSTFSNTKLALLLGGDDSKTLENSATLLCDAERCLYSLASLMKAGLTMWKEEGKRDGNDDKATSGAAMTSLAGASTKPYLVAMASVSPQEEEKERKRQLRKERVAGRQNPYAKEEAEEGGAFREEKENREYLSLLMKKFDEIIVKNSKNNKTEDGESSDKNEAEKSWELETERRWAIAGADPFLVTLRNVDAALCEYLKNKEDSKTISRWYDFLGFVVGNNEAKIAATRCPSISLRHRGNNNNNENASMIEEKQKTQFENCKEIVKFVSASSSAPFSAQSSLIPALKKHFADSPVFFAGNDNKKEFILSEYVGKQFAGAANAGEVPFSQSSASSPSYLKEFNLSDDELIAGAAFLKKQSGVVKSWIHQ